MTNTKHGVVGLWKSPVAAGLLSIMAMVSLAALAAEPLMLVHSETSVDGAIDAVVLKEVYTLAGVPMVVTPLPSARAATESASGRADGEVSRVASYGTTRPNMLRVEPPLAQLSWLVMYPKSAPFSIKTTADLKNYNVAYIRGYKGAEALLEGSTKVLAVGSISQLIQILSIGRVDAMLSTQLDFEVEALSQGADLSGLVRVELHKEPTYHFLHEKNAAMLPVISGVLAKLKKSGKLGQMREKAEKDYLANLAKSVAK